MKISFDFDGTLEDDFDGTENTQKKEIQELAKKYIKEGHEVCIITKRYGQRNYRDGKGNEFVEVFQLASELGITKIHFTNRDMKFSHILDLGIDMHFENSDYEVQLINQVCRERNYRCVVVPVEEKNWRELV